MNKETVITGEGLKRLERELEELKTVKRKEIAERIKIALSFGDLTENASTTRPKTNRHLSKDESARLKISLKRPRAR